MKKQTANIMEMEMETKVCKKCGRELELTELGYSKQTTDGYAPHCNDCRLAINARQKAAEDARRAARFWECDIIAKPEKDIKYISKKR